MPEPSTGLSDAISRHVAGLRYEDLSPATRHAAKRALLDASGVTLAASGLCPEVAPFVKLARNTGSGGNCTLLGFGDRVHAPQAAFANGAMGHALDFEDAFDRAPVHPNVSAIPAAIAITQAYGPVHGRELVTAIAIGCDLVCRIGLSLRQRLEDGGWYPPTLLGGIGATVVAARLLALSPEQIRDALSLGLCQVTAPGAIKHSASSVVRAVREAFPAQAAVTAALLARDGVAGFEEPLEGTDAFYELYANGRYAPADVLDALGRDNLTEQLSFKQWPACRGTHAHIQIALDLQRQHGFRASDIAGIDLMIGPVQQMLVTPAARKQAPMTAIDAKFSIPFTVAVALVRGRVTLEDFAPAARSDPQILKLAAHTTANLNPEWTAEEAARGALTIRLRDGQCLSGQVDEPLGSPSTPIGDDALIAKFVNCSAHAAQPLGTDQAAAAARRILALDTEPDSGDCFRLAPQ